MQTLKQFVASKGKAFWAPLRQRNPLPFPGRYPTRWQIYVKDMTKKQTAFFYLGKPNVEIARKIWDYLGLPYLDIVAMEFDKGGCFNLASFKTPRHYAPVAARLETVNGFYYPFHRVNHGFFDPWRTKKMYFKGVATGRNRQWFVYSPWEKILDNPERVARAGSYRNWVNKYKLISAFKKHNEEHFPSGIEVLHLGALPKPEHVAPQSLFQTASTFSWEMLNHLGQPSQVDSVWHWHRCVHCGRGINISRQGVVHHGHCPRCGVEFEIFA